MMDSTSLYVATPIPSKNALRYTFAQPNERYSGLLSANQSSLIPYCGSNRVGIRKRYNLRSSPVVCDEVHQLRTPRVCGHVVGKGNASGTPLTETGYSQAVRRSCLIFSHLSAACARPRAGAELQVSKRSCVCVRVDEGLAGFRSMVDSTIETHPSSGGPASLTHHPTHHLQHPAG